MFLGKFQGAKFISDRWITLFKNGKPVTEPDGLYSRPLRAITPQGERVSLACSDCIEPTVTLDFHVTILDHTDKGKGIGTASAPVLLDQELLESWLGYGQLCGLGQFRNGSFGRFEAEVIRNRCSFTALPDSNWQRLSFVHTAPGGTPKPS